MANIYKSNYTGAQVDDAVKKVLTAAPGENDELNSDINIINNTATTPTTDTVDVVTTGAKSATDNHTISNSRVKVPTKKYVDNKVSSYLPLSGGTVTGNLKSTGSNPVESTNGFKKTDFDNTYVLLAGGGAKLLSELGGGSGGTTLANGTTLYLHKITLTASNGSIANFSFYSDKGSSYTGDLATFISDFGAVSNLIITDGNVIVNNTLYCILNVTIDSGLNVINVTYYNGSTSTDLTSWTSINDKVAKMASLGGDVTDVTFGGTGSALTVTDSNLSLVDGLHIRGKMPAEGTPSTIKLNGGTAHDVRNQQNETPQRSLSSEIVVEFIYNSSVDGGIWQVWGVDSLTDNDTHFTAGLLVGATGTTSNSATTNGNTYLKLVEQVSSSSTIVRSNRKIQGAGATTVTSDSSGNITISSTDTNTDTKVTSVNNHYSPTANSSYAINRDASSTTEATWGTTSLVTGVNIQRDAKGHVTGMTLDSIKMPAKPETGATLPFIEIVGSTTTYPISGTFTNDQASALVSKAFSAISFRPSGSADSVPLLLQTSEQIHYEYIYQGSDDTYTYILTASLNQSSSGWTDKSYTVARVTKIAVEQTNGIYRYTAILDLSGTNPYSNGSVVYPEGCSYREGQLLIDLYGTVAYCNSDLIATTIFSPRAESKVTSLGGKTGAITLGSGLSISSNNVLSATGSSSSGSSSVEVIDLGSYSSSSSYPASLTSDQVSKFVSWGANGINAIQIYDNDESGGTMPILILNGNYQNRTFYYTGIWGNTKYSATVEFNYQLDDTSVSENSGYYSITKSTVSTGGSSSEDNEQKTYLGASFVFSTYGQSSYVSTNVDSSVAGLTDAEITGLIFDCQKSQYNGSTVLASYSYQLKLDDLYRMFTSDSMGVKSASMTIFNQQISLVFSDISTSYSQGTVNYNIPIMITPSFENNYDVLNINIGFTYKGFKFANGGTY